MYSSSTGRVVERMSRWSSGRREEKPDDRQVEDHREDEEFVGVELAAAVAVPGPFDGGDAGLGEALAEVGLEPLGEFVLGPAAQFAGCPEVECDDLVEVDVGRVERGGSDGGGGEGCWRDRRATIYGSLDRPPLVATMLGRIARWYSPTTRIETGWRLYW